MNAIYQVVGISKQGFHQRMDRLLAKLEVKAQLLPLLHKIRKDHPRMSARVMYEKLKPETLGRDAFIDWAHQEGFKLTAKKRLNLSAHTLDSMRFPNLIAGRELTGVNQVWVSDITYVKIRDQWFFLTLIMDLFSRRIVGHHASSSLRTEHTTIPALRGACRTSTKIKGLIFHSDGGGQYFSKSFLAMTRQIGIRNSMSYQVLENAHAERLMGIIKNDYLKAYQPTSLPDLKAKLDKAVWMYNHDRPHRSLQGMCPVEFEEHIQVNVAVEMWITPRYIPLKVTHIPTV